MTEKQVKEGLYKYLENELNTYGYKWLKSKGVIRKYTSYGFNDIQLLFEKGKEVPFYIDYYLGIRLDKVQEIFCKYWFGDPAYCKDTMTHLLSLDHIKNNLDFHYFVEEEGDIPLLGGIVLEDIVSYGLPFWEKYSDLNSMNNLFNYEREDLQIQRYLIPARNFTALILAGLVKDKNLPELTLKYDLEFKKHLELHPKDFNTQVYYPERFQALLNELANL